MDIGSGTASREGEAPAEPLPAVSPKCARHTLYASCVPIVLQPGTLVRELAALAEFDAGSILVDEVTVYGSSLGPAGPTYDPLAHAPLG